MTFELHRADARRLPLADATVDLIVTSPPYFALRSYQDDGGHYAGQIGSEPTPAEFLRALWAVLDECWRVLKPSGSCFVNLGDKFAGSGGHNNDGIGAKSTLQGNGHVGGGPKIKATRRSAPDSYNQASDVRAKSRMLLPHRFALGAIDPDYRTHVEGRDGDWPQWVCRMDMVWAKPNGLPESVTDRVRASHEYWFHLTREGRYFAAVDEVREEYSPETAAKYEAGGLRLSIGDGTHPSKLNTQRLDGDVDGWRGNPLGKLPGSVWSVASEPLRVPDHLPQHFAAFPSEWPRRLIAGWSPTGICTACGEGRRPVVDETFTPKQGPRGEGNRRSVGGEIGHDGGCSAPGYQAGHKDVTITGYLCGCPEPTAPTRPAVVLDPFCGTGTTVAVAHLLGRHGIGVDLSADYLRLAAWRCTQDWSLYGKATGGDPDSRDPDQLALFEVTA